MLIPPEKDPFPSARHDAEASKSSQDIPQTRSHAYRLSFLDEDFMLREELRPVRLQLELLQPELIQQEQNIRSTVVIFGSARIPDRETGEMKAAQAEAALAENPEDEKLQRQAEIARNVADKAVYYEQAREVAQVVSQHSQEDSHLDLVVITGGGPGIMEAGNLGAHDVSAKSIGLNIVLPHEQAPNSYISPDLCFQFHYFAIRKMHFLMRAVALVAFPGGFGTMDELFEALTLVQTGKIQPLPIILFGEKYWRSIVNFEQLVAEGMISPEDLELFIFVETVEEAWQKIAESEYL